MTNDALDATIQRFVEQFSTVDEAVTVVLKGHLLIEEALDEIISNFVFHAEPISDARFGFAQKLHLARAMSLREHENSMWQIGSALNSLRNELAHKLDLEKRSKRIRAVLDAYDRETRENPSLNEMVKLPEPQALLMACAFFLGFLSTFRAEVERFRKVVHTLEKVMNVDRAEG